MGILAIDGTRSAACQFFWTVNPPGEAGISDQANAVGDAIQLDVSTMRTNSKPFPGGFGQTQWQHPTTTKARPASPDNRNK